MLERGEGTMPQVCWISMPISAPVIDGCAGVLPEAGLSEIARTHAARDDRDAIPSAQPAW